MLTQLVEAGIKPVTGEGIDADCLQWQTLLLCDVICRLNPAFSSNEEELTMPGIRFRIPFAVRSAESPGPGTQIAVTATRA